ncbi:MAG TPA: HEAT repeat domain-containing protein, partial [Methylomirabilota bacterium]|nr:HEAT repeat domain-containing protein [Methylomirabilota bacterium]
PKTRLHALWTLEGLEAVSPVLLRQALVDPHPAVRAAAVQLSEPFLRHNAAPALADALLRAVDDESPAVRFQVALSLGEWDSPVAGAALARLALRDAGDDVLQTGVLTSAARHVDPMLQTLLVGPHTPPPPARLLDALLGVATAERNEPALVRTLQHLTTPAPGQNARAIWQQESLAAFLDALDRRGLALERFRAEAGTSLRRVLDALSAVFAEARRTVESPDLSGNPAAAVAATRLLARTEADREPDLRRLAGLLQPSIPPEVQSAAIAALKRVNHAAAADPLLAGWAGFSPGLREEALSLLMSRQMWVARLLDAVEGGTLGPADLPLTTRQALLAHSHPPTRERATRLLATGDARRARLLDDYRGLAELKGDPARGAELYRANCGICHRLRGEGQSVGPDLDAVVGKPLEALLAAILDPNQAVEWRYVAYQAETRSGHEVTGIITAETPSSVTLRTAAGREETLLRSDLVRFNSSKLSLMPEGFEQILPPPAMADLVAFLRQR